MAKRNQPERQEQVNICNLTRSLGGRVWVLGTTRRKGDYQGTNQTPGLPDLWLVLPSRNGHPAMGIWWEVKAPNGKRTEEQMQFAEACQGAGVHYGWGPLDTYIAYLRYWDRLRPDQIGAHHGLRTP